MAYQYVNVDKDAYEETERRLRREDNTIIHPRTREIIISCSEEQKPTFNKKHLSRFPAIAYNQQINRQQINGKFTITTSKDIREKLKPTDAKLLTLKLKGKLEFRKTKQYKTVWFTKTQRRK